MADKKEANTGIYPTLLNWWNSQSAPPPPSRNPPVDPRTGNRTKPSPEFSWTGEGWRNVLAELQRSGWTTNYLRDLAKGIYSTGKTIYEKPSVLRNPFEGMGELAAQISAAQNFEQTGKWSRPPGHEIKSGPAGARYDTPEWRNQALATYRKFMAPFSYVDPKSGKRATDFNAVQRAMSNDPVGTLAPLLTEGAGAAGKIARITRGMSEAAEASGALSKAKLLRGTANAARTVQVAGDVTAKGLNPAGYVASKVLVAPIKVAKAIRGVQVLDKQGNLVPAVVDALKAGGYDPALYSTPEAKVQLQRILGKKGITQATVREAVGVVGGVPVPRSVALREAPPRQLAPDVERATSTGAGQIDQRVAGQFGHPPDERDLGDAFSRAYVNGKQGVKEAFDQAFSHQGFFTNTGDFSAGVRAAIDAELAPMGLDTVSVMSAPRFAQSHNALGGFRRDNRTFKGLFDQLDDLGGQSTVAPIMAKDLSGQVHAFDPVSGNWIDGSGRPVTARGKVQYLNAASNRANISAQAPGQNGLTPRNIDSLRRDVNSFYRAADNSEDQSVLSAINRGLDNYLESNSANFSGNGRALAQDLRDARSAHQNFLSTFDKSPNKVISDASRLASPFVEVGPSGRFEFTGDPTAKAGITAHLENRILDPKTLQPKINYTGANTVTGDRVMNNLYGILDPQGQEALVSHIRNTVATSPAKPESVRDFLGKTTFFSPQETEEFSRLQNAKSVVTDPALATSTTPDGTGSRWGMRLSAPYLGHQLGSAIGEQLGAPKLGSWLGTAVGSVVEGKGEQLAQRQLLKRELAGAPAEPVAAPNLFMPITAAESLSGVTRPTPAPAPSMEIPTQVSPPVLSPQQERDPYALPASIEAARPQPQSQPQRQKEADPYALPPGFEDHDKDPYALPPGFEEPKNQWRGGRAAYKSGGKVGTKDIEPLISALMNKAKQAKKVSNKATEPLLNAKDDAIASALAVAQKAI